MGDPQPTVKDAEKKNAGVADTIVPNVDTPAAGPPKSSAPKAEAARVAAPSKEESLLETRAAIAHLLRRAGFGADPEQWDAFKDLEYDQAVTKVMDEVRAPPAKVPSRFDPYQPGSIQQFWLERMVRTRGGPAEKLALFWHGHFATSDAKIKDSALMWQQYGLIRKAGCGSFRELVLRISRDPAMIRWLDGNANRKGTANENYARELQELFTLGIGNYTEQDVREIARAFTGWGSRHHSYVFRKHFHDEGEKTIHGKTGAFGGEDVVTILTELPACSKYVARELLRFYSHPAPTADEIASLAGTLAKNEMRMDAGLEHMFRDPAFRTVSHARSLVRGPVDFLISALRCSDVRTVPPWIHGSLDRMGQILFRPPSVKGWTSGTGWLSAGAVVERLRSAEKIAKLAPMGAFDSISEIAFDGHVPDALAASMEGMNDKQRIATLLGGPDYQLS